MNTDARPDPRFPRSPTEARAVGYAARWAERDRRLVPRGAVDVHAVSARLIKIVMPYVVGASGQVPGPPTLVTCERGQAPTTTEYSQTACTYADSPIARANARPAIEHASGRRPCCRADAATGQPCRHGSGLWLPGPSVRVRRTALYGSLFLASGAGVLAITHLLVRGATTRTTATASTPGGSALVTTQLDLHQQLVQFGIARAINDRSLAAWPSSPALPAPRRQAHAI